MTNFTFQIKDCAIPTKPYQSATGNFLSGKLMWRDGTIDFEKNFHTFSPDAINLIEAHFGAENRFEVSGTLTKKAGKKGTQWESKFFEEFIVQEIKITNGTKRLSARELVDEALERINEEEIPF
jgi:hypothetical protein